MRDIPIHSQSGTEHSTRPYMSVEEEPPTQSLVRLAVVLCAFIGILLAFVIMSGLLWLIVHILRAT